MPPLGERDPNQPVSLRSAISSSSVRPPSAGKSQDGPDVLGRSVASMLKNDLGDLLSMAPQDRMPAFLNRSSQIPRAKHSFVSSSTKAVHRAWPSTTSSGPHRSFTSSITAPPRSLPDTSSPNPVIANGSVPPLPSGRRSNEYRSYSMTTTGESRGLSSQRSFASLNSDVHSTRSGHGGTFYHRRAQQAGYRTPSPAMDEMMRHPQSIRPRASSIGFRGRDSPLSDYGPPDRFNSVHQHVHRPSHGPRTGPHFRPVYEQHNRRGPSFRSRTPIARYMSSSECYHPQMVLAHGQLDSTPAHVRPSRIPTPAPAQIPHTDEDLPQVFDYSSYIHFAEELPTDDEVTYQVSEAGMGQMRDRVQTLLRPGTPSLETLRQQSHRTLNPTNQSFDHVQVPPTPIPAMPGAFGSYDNIAELAGSDVAAAELPASPVGERNRFTLTSIPNILRQPSEYNLVREAEPDSKACRIASAHQSYDSSVLSGGAIASSSSEAVGNVHSSMTDMTSNSSQPTPPKAVTNTSSQIIRSARKKPDRGNDNITEHENDKLPGHKFSQKDAIEAAENATRIIDDMPSSQQSMGLYDRSRLPSQSGPRSHRQSASAHIFDPVEVKHVDRLNGAVSGAGFGDAKSELALKATTPGSTVCSPSSQSLSNRPTSPPPTPWQRINKSRASSTTHSIAADRSATTIVTESASTIAKPRVNAIKLSPRQEQPPSNDKDHTTELHDGVVVPTNVEPSVTGVTNCHVRPESTIPKIQEPIPSSSPRVSKKDSRWYEEIAVGVAKRLVRDTPFAKHIAGKPSRCTSLDTQSTADTEPRAPKRSKDEISDENGVSQPTHTNLSSPREDADKLKPNRFIPTKFRFPSTLLASKEDTTSLTSSTQLPDQPKSQHDQERLSIVPCGPIQQEVNIPDSQEVDLDECTEVRISGDKYDSTTSLVTTHSRNLPSLHFSRLDLTSDIRDSLWTGSFDFSMDMVSFDKSLMPESDTRYKYQSVFDRLDAYSPEAYQDSAPQSRQNFTSEVNSVKTGRNSTKLSVASSANRSMPSQAYIDEINRLSIPSTNDLALHFSELIPSLGLLSSPGISIPEMSSGAGLDRTLTQIHKIGHAEPFQRISATLPNVPSDVMFRPVPGSESLVLMSDSEFEAFMRVQKARVEGRQNPTVKDTSSSTHVSNGLNLDASSTSSITRPVPTLTRAQSESALRGDCGRRHSPPRSHAAGVSLPNIQQPSPAVSRPWNLDKSYTWTTPVANLDIIFPKTPADHRLSPTPARNGNDGSFLARSVAESPLNDNRDISANRCSDKQHLSPTPTPLGGNPIGGNGRPGNNVKQSGSRNSRVCSGDRYPTTGLSPPDEAHFVDDVDHRSWFSDDSSLLRRPAGFRRRFTRIRSRNAIPRDRTQSRRSLRTRSRGGDVSPIQDEESLAEETVSIRSYSGAVGMGRLEFGARKMAERVKLWWFKSGTLLRSLGLRRMPSPAFGTGDSNESMADRHSDI
jgi:hypothetical protein